MVAQGTVTDLFHTLKVDRMEGAQSFCPLYRVDFCCEPEGDSEEEVVGVDVERKSALYELALHRVDQVSGQKDRHFPYKRGRDVFCGLVLVDVLEGLEEHIGVGV